MQTEDILKLIYQNNFGCGHLVSDKEAAYKRLCDEMNSIDSQNTELVYDIGNGYVRLDLKAAKYKNISKDLISELFYISACDTKIILDDFYNDISIFRSMCESGKLSYSEKEIHAFLKKWEAQGRPPFSHTEAYRQKYSPSYRVLLKRYADFIMLFDRISKLSERKPIVVGIDGRCGSGKTTLSDMISKVFGCQVIHADDFFLPPEKRTEKRLSEAGGNFDYERFQSQVIKGIESRDSFEYDVFSCCEMKLTDKKEIRPYNILVVEGSYCMHPYLDDVYDIKVFTDISPEKQKERIIKRNGNECYKRFEEKWIPMEEKYFASFNIAGKCDFKY